MTRTTKRCPERGSAPAGPAASGLEASDALAEIRNMKRPVPQPTNSELEILSVLWDRGPSTVRQVHEALGDHPPRGYTTVLKLMQIMTEKGMVHRNESGRAHVYASAVSQESTRRRLIDDLAERAFGGSALKLALQALSTTPASEEELAKIRDMIEAAGREADARGPTSAPTDGEEL